MTPGEKTHTWSGCENHFSASPSRGRQFEVSIERHLLDVGDRVGPSLETFKEGKQEEKKQCRQGCDNDVYMSAGEVRMR